ncbi:DUF4426 domain-containing protein [Pseudomonas aeruginosa]|uniref:DUF4426 domain-containing protein n=1 Tax=Pseudomonas aeruginosa TaxID=287 RepID=UPI0029C9C645|nr:DUF4426 domain-containing protein [Pseudomonas aeruginosa]HEJ3350050.1 DUF4426 domain-containing protein [Pseudomonas aeruginosa]
MRRFTAFVLGLCLSLPVLAEQVQRFGDLDVHYNVFNSSFLQPNVASAVGLVRSKAQGVINVVPMEKGKPVEAAVTGSAKDLTGKVIPLEFRRVSEEGAIYNLAQFPISQRETLVFTIKVEVKGEPAQTFSFNKEIFPDE